MTEQNMESVRRSQQQGQHWFLTSFRSLPSPSSLFFSFLGYFSEQVATGVAHSFIVEVLSFAVLVFEQTHINVLHAVILHIFKN